MIFIPKKIINIYPGEIRDIARLLFSGNLQEGSYISKFENNFSEYIGTKYSISVSSGRFAFYCILEALGITENDEIIIPAYTFKAVPRTILKLGAKPVFADIDENTLNINSKNIEKNITSRTKAVVATHLFGSPADLDDLSKICHDHGLNLIEDCAHSCGATYSGKKVGSFGKASFFSFGISKNINTFGGGMITTNDEAIFKFIRKKLQEFCFPPSKSILAESAKTFFYSLLLNPQVYSLLTHQLLFIINSLGFDPMAKLRSRSFEFADKWAKMANLQSCIGVRLLQRLDRLNEMKFRKIKYLKERLNQNLSIQGYSEKAMPCFLYLAILCKDPINAQKKLFKNGIDSDRFFMQNCARLFGDQHIFSVTENVCNRVLLIQFPHDLSEEKINELAAILNTSCY